MSSIAQVRLAAISHRCLNNCMTWRHHAKDTMQTSFIRLHHKKTQQHINPPSTKSIPTLGFNRPYSTSSGRKLFNLQQMTQFDTLHLSLFNTPKLALTCSRRNLSNIVISLGYKSHSDNSQHDEGGGHETGGDSARPKLQTKAPLLAFLGLFSGVSTKELEEEKAKLSDEERVKKMKPVELLIARGVLAMCDKEHAKADGLFHEALKLAQDEKNDEQDLFLCNLIASNYFEGGNLELAEKLFVELIKRMLDRDMDTSDPAILELSLKLASIYGENPRTHEKATKGYKFVISSLLTNLKETLIDFDSLDVAKLSEELRNEIALLGWSYDWFGKHLMAVNDYVGAVEMLEEALKVSRKVLGSCHEQTLILMNDVGSTLAMAGSPKEGQKYLIEAIEGAIKNESKELPAFYVNLGLINVKLNKLQEAQRYCQNSIEIASKNPEHYNYDDVVALSRKCLKDIESLIEGNRH